MNQATDELLSVCRAFLWALRSLGWQVLLIGSGLHLEIAACAERFVADWAATLEQRQAYPERLLRGSWPHRLAGSIWARIFRVVRRARPGTEVWRQRAVRWDAALLARRGPGQRQESRHLRR